MAKIRGILKISKWMEATKLVYSFPSFTLWRQEIGGGKERWRLWKQSQSCGALSSFKWPPYQETQRLPGRLFQQLLTDLWNSFLSCRLNSSEFIIHSFCALNDKPLVKCNLISKDIVQIRDGSIRYTDTEKWFLSYHSFYFTKPFLFLSSFSLFISLFLIYSVNFCLC